MCVDNIGKPNSSFLTMKQELLEYVFYKIGCNNVIVRAKITSLDITTFDGIQVSRRGRRDHMEVEEGKYFFCLNRKFVATSIRILRIFKIGRFMVYSKYN